MRFRILFKTGSSAAQARFCLQVGRSGAAPLLPDVFDPRCEPCTVSGRLQMKSITIVVHDSNAPVTREPPSKVSVLLFFIGFDALQKSFLHVTYISRKVCIWFGEGRQTFYDWLKVVQHHVALANFAAATHRHCALVYSVVRLRFIDFESLTGTDVV